MSTHSRRRFLAPALILILIVASVGGIYAYQHLGARSTNGGTSSTSTFSVCDSPLGSSNTLRTQLPPPTILGGVTEFTLPSPLREPNAPTVAPDGSVWFGEQSVVALAHFYPNNRTLVEYAWPFNYATPPSTDGFCGDKTSTWGVALWDGKVWATDTSGNRLVALNPATGQFTTVKVPTKDAFPYNLTPGPDNTLWFPELFGGQIGVLSQNGTVHEYPLPGGASSEPAQIVFANSTTGYYSSVYATKPDAGGIYSFNTSRFSPVLVGGQNFNDPTGLALSSGALWVALHGSSSVASYSFTTKSWSYYPTSAVTWDGSPVTTLPYFVNSNGSEVWVNEHYGNRMAMVDPANGSLVEYSESSVPTTGNTIGNALTFALGGGRAWFAEETGNVLGYADASYTPGFSTSIAGNRTVVVDTGSSATVDLVVHDTTHQGPLNLTFSDSESYFSTPQNLTFSVLSSSISPPKGGESDVTVTVSALESLKPGTYYAILTATDGETFVSSFLKIVVP